MNQLFICSSNKKDYEALLTLAKLPELQITENIKQAKIILGEPLLIAQCIEKAENVQWIQSTFAGCDKLIGLKKQDYQLTNVRGVFGSLMSEYVFGHLISFERNFAYYKESELTQSWAPIPYSSLANQTIAILGTGSIGQHIASTAKHFGMRTLGVNFSGKPVPFFDEVVKSLGLQNALARANVVVCVLPSTAQTSGLLNKKTLSFCKHAIFFNVGRGSALVEEDLIWAIEQQHIKHAFLDVFVKEPLESNHPFWTNNAITITPHNSAISFPNLVFGIFTENYQRFIEKKPLNHIIDFKKGY